jgi:hypothetical protein
MVARVSRRSELTGLTRTMEFDHLDQLAFERKMNAIERGRMSYAEAFGGILSQDAIRWLETGISKDEWELKYGDRARVGLVYDEDPNNRLDDLDMW